MTPAEWRSHIAGHPESAAVGLLPLHDYSALGPLHILSCVLIISTVDVMSVGVAFTEIHMMYAALVDGGRPIRLAEAGSYHDYCVRQRAYTSALDVGVPGDTPVDRVRRKQWRNPSGLPAATRRRIGDPLTK